MLQSNQKIIRHKAGLLNRAEELGNVSKACQMMGLSRDTFYRYRDTVEEGGGAYLTQKFLHCVFRIEQLAKEMAWVPV